MIQRGPILAKQMITIIENFPSQIKAIASRLSVCNEGPFPLVHDDFSRSNIIVDKNSFEVMGIIDWEGAFTAPYELISFPSFLAAMPASFDLPEKYDQDGQPLDERLRERWRQRGEYLEIVRSVELEESDHLFSACLSSERGQMMAYLYGVYGGFGKLYFYDRVMEELRGMIKLESENEHC